MRMPESEDTTNLLLALRDGEFGALDRLVPRVYAELHRIAHRVRARKADADGPPTTALVHEAYLKLVDQSRIDVADRARFLALAATAMRHIVIDDARRRLAGKRGGRWQRLSLDAVVPVWTERSAEIVELDEALQRLERFDERLCRVVECRFFGGLTVAETATALGVSARTVDRAWQKAKAWLHREIHEAE